MWPSTDIKITAKVDVEYYKHAVHSQLHSEMSIVDSLDAILGLFQCFCEMLLCCCCCVAVVVKMALSVSPPVSCVHLSCSTNQKAAALLAPPIGSRNSV